MKQITYSIFSVVILAFFLYFPVTTEAQITLQDNGTTAPPAAPVLQDNGTTASPQPSSTPVPPVLQDNGTTAGTVADTSKTATVVKSTSVGGGSIGTGSVTNVSANTYTVQIVPTATTSCNFITENIKTGIKNSADQVIKLQNFLKDTEKMDVNVTGIFDQKTIQAVKIFQAKYTVDILDPWNVKVPTGNVYHTTRKKINEIHCKSPVSLTAAQIAEISSYKNSAKKAVQIAQALAAPAPIAEEKTKAEAQAEVRSESQTAAASDTETPRFSKRLWDFTKSIFGR